LFLLWTHEHPVTNLEGGTSTALADLIKESGANTDAGGVRVCIANEYGVGTSSRV
jgi:hypothetical protein